MEPPRQKRFARILLALGAAAGLAWFVATDFARKISTDVLDLIPPGERAPELALVRSLAAEQRSRIALCALAVPAGSPRGVAAAEAFVAALRASPAVAEAWLLRDPAPRDALGAHLLTARFELLLPAWLAERRREHAAQRDARPWPEWLAERTAVELEAFLPRPEALAFQNLLPRDPLLLLPRLADAVRGLDPSAAEDGGTVLIWARAAGSPLREEGQTPLFAAVDRALASARAIEPAAGLRWTSIARFAAESRRRIEGELSTLNLVSLAAVLAVAALCVRRMFKALHLAPVVLGGLLGAWMATTLAFDRVHVLVFVVGSLLGGVAIDYGFYLFLQPPARPGEPYRAKARRLLKPLLASALTTILGFCLLLFSELPLLRQLGVFVSAGLLCALAAALVWFAQLDETFLETRAFARYRPSVTGRTRRLAQLLLAVGAIVAVAGPWRLRWHDDIRELEIPAPALRAEATEVRALFGERADRAVYLTHGATPAAARAALARFSAWHTAQFSGQALASAGEVVPTPEAWGALAAERAALGEFASRLRAALERHGFDATAFAPFFEEWETWRAAPPGNYDAVVGRFASALRGPLATLFSVAPDSCWFVSLAPHPAGAEPPPGTATASVSQLENLNRLFARYRASALRLSVAGLALVGLSVFALYGGRRGARMFAIPVGACLFTFGVLGAAGQTLNLFHLLGAFLGVCLSHNYAIFSAENAARGEAPPPSIRLSALTTAASFGVLALSQIPVVAALGVTVAGIVLAALAIVELESCTASPPPV
ncbi:MAG: hypothetical protein RLZZ15_4554 [Verrucomicrobiota bacterium]|jgi:predicted exporter